VVLRDHRHGEERGDGREEPQDEQGAHPQLSHRHDARQPRVVGRDEVQVADDHPVGSVLRPVGQDRLQRRMREPTQLVQAGPEQADAGRDPEQREGNLQSLGHRRSLTASFYPPATSHAIPGERFPSAPVEFLR